MDDGLKRAEGFLRAQRVARLATVDRRGRPHLVPIVFAYAGGCLYTPIDLKPKVALPGRLRRVRNIAANPQVQVLVDRYDEDWRRLGYVQLRGRAELIERGYQHRRALRLLERKYLQYAELPLRGRPVIKVTVEQTVTWGRLEPQAEPARSGAARWLSVDELKRARSGERVSFRARVLRTWVAGTVATALVGDATGLIRVEQGRHRLTEGAGYSFRSGLVREYEGGWRSVQLDGVSRARRLEREVSVEATSDYIERTARILMTMTRKRGAVSGPR